MSTSLPRLQTQNRNNACEHLLERVWFNVGGETKRTYRLEEQNFCGNRGIYVQISRQDASHECMLKTWHSYSSQFLTVEITFDMKDRLLTHPMAEMLIAAENKERELLVPSVEVTRICDIAVDDFDPFLLEECNMTACDSLVFSPHHNLPFTVDKRMELYPTSADDIDAFYGNPKPFETAFTAPYIADMSAYFHSPTTIKFILRCVTESERCRFPTSVRMDAISFSSAIKHAMLSKDYTNNAFQKHVPFRSISNSSCNRMFYKLRKLEQKPILSESDVAFIVRQKSLEAQKRSKRKTTQ